MATKNCNICQLQGKISTPEVWCPECEEFLCSTCSKQHHLQKATKDHSTISYDDYCKLPPFILNIQIICEEHKEKYQYYCKSHDTPLCKKCVFKSHKKCDDTPEIDDVIHSIKSSAIFEDVWVNLKETHQTVVKAIKSREDNLNHLQRKKEDLSKQVKEKTQRLIDQIKKTENNILSELDIIFHENADKIKATTKILKSREKKTS